MHPFGRSGVPDASNSISTGYVAERLLLRLASESTASDDADAADTPIFVAQSGTAGAYGSFDVDASGVWSYTLDNAAAQSLAGGESVTETVTVTATEYGRRATDDGRRVRCGVRIRSKEWLCASRAMADVYPLTGCARVPLTVGRDRCRISTYGMNVTSAQQTTLPPKNGIDLADAC